MYFVNEEHHRNFNLLMMKYPIGQNDSQYMAGFYIVAHPVIFDHCDGNPVCDGHGPFDWYFEEQENPQRHRAALSGSYSFLVKAGLSLYNNHRHDDHSNDFTLYLALGTWGDELFKVFIEACQIRRQRITLNVA